ncbi:hypothetical protein KSP40_PGU007526 [Platanthera guangdongensis]|uniref:Ubiquitin-like protease family profile domain-containing protein n=1 Tax=Platanthera guangdongensis TaxID=2320717 RepID=A0ABR2MZI7_9ASPA
MEQHRLKKDKKRLRGEKEEKKEIKKKGKEENEKKEKNNKEVKEVKEEKEVGKDSIVIERKNIFISRSNLIDIIGTGWVCSTHLDAYAYMRYIQEDTVDVLPRDIASCPLRVVEGLPTQDNSNDCGIFVMKYMKASVVEGPVDWKSHKTWEKDMSRIRAELVAFFARFFSLPCLKKMDLNFNCPEKT